MRLTVFDLETYRTYVYVWPRNIPNECLTVFDLETYRTCVYVWPRNIPNVCLTVFDLEHSKMSRSEPHLGCSATEKEDRCHKADLSVFILVLLLCPWVLPICYTSLPFICYTCYLCSLQAGIAQSLQRYGKSWTVRELNAGGGEIFRTRPALGSTQPPIRWIPGQSQRYSGPAGC
jgi:hypothetical protein